MLSRTSDLLMEYSAETTDLRQVADGTHNVDLLAFLAETICEVYWLRRRALWWIWKCLPITIFSHLAVNIHSGTCV